MKIRTIIIYDNKTGNLKIEKQEIVEEDEDWNLADEKYDYSYAEDDVKQCRDLIIEDIINMKLPSSPTLVYADDVIETIKKRFGDLQ